MDKKNIAKASLGISFLTFLGSIAGFIRQIIITYYFGATNKTDAFFAALLIPTLAISLFGGAVSTIIIPFFTDNLFNRDKEEAMKFASSILNFSFIINLVLILFIAVFMKRIVSLEVPGFSRNEINMTVRMAFIMLPIIIFSTSILMISAILNSLKLFLIASSQNLIINLFVVLFIFFFRKVGIESIAYGFLFAYVIFAIIDFFYLLKLNFKFTLTFDMKVLKPIKIAILAVISIQFIELFPSFFNNLFSSYLAKGSITYLNIAHRLRNFNISLIAYPLSTALFPYLSQNFSEKTKDNFSENLLFGFRILNLISIPLIFILVFFANDIVAILFYHGNFNKTDTANTSSVLVAYSWSLVAYIYIIVLIKVFFAMKEFIIPIVASFIFAAINVFFDFVLVNHLKVVGIASANSIALSCEFIIMFTYLLSKKVKIKFWKEFVIPLLKIITASVAMALISKFIFLNLKKLNMLYSGFHNSLPFLLTALIASLIYITILKLLRFEDVNLIFYIPKKIVSRFIKK
ncbi:MAG: murein biosynthesis integral membrane protein MurJ [Deltaproteobacteria bacterium]|nr:murein biosynthesis integral membrane protein MurJ [Deltaproteobacteria bacterium]